MLDPRLFQVRGASRYLLQVSEDPPRGEILFESASKAVGGKLFYTLKVYRKMLLRSFDIGRMTQFQGRDDSLAQEVFDRQFKVLKGLAFHAYEKHRIGIFMTHLLCTAFDYAPSKIPTPFKRPNMSDVRDCYEQWMDMLSECIDSDECESEMRELLGIEVCESCGERFHQDDLDHIRGDYICRSCRDDQYTWSDYEGEWIDNDNVINALDERGNDVVVHCENNDFHWSDEHDAYVHDDYEAIDRPPGVNNIIGDYHSSRHNYSPKHDSWTNRHKYLMGVELEVEAFDVYKCDAAMRIHGIVNSGGMRGERMFFERDGSLSDGFEMITQPMSLPALAETFKFLENPEATKGLRSHMTKTCGLHVHVSKRGLTALQINKIVAFVNDPNHEWLIRAVARRYSTGFCAIKEKKIGHLHYSQSDRYEAVNLQGARTIEFRIFKGSLKYRSVMAAIEFCHALIQFCRPAEAGIHDLTAEKFLMFCRNKMRKETANLIGFLDARLPGHKKAA